MDKDKREPEYRIGVASKLSGVSVDNIRMWERRYQVVTPARSDTNVRLYSRADIDKLRVIKELLDDGYSIGDIARLSLQELQKRLSEVVQSGIGKAAASATPIRVITLGSLLSIKLADSAMKAEGIEFCASYKSLYTFEEQAADQHADVVVVEYPTLGNNTAEQVNHLLTISRASFAIVCYEFGTRNALQQLNNSHCMTLRGSFSPAELSRLIHNRFRQGTDEMAAALAAPVSQLPIRPRRFTDENLVKIANADTAVKCECPHHLTDLILKLSAFEKYSAECESRNAKDMALHAYLYQTTARARAMLEEALMRVVEADGISIDAA